jgi:simple sugar transport system permease protein
VDSWQLILVPLISSAIRLSVPIILTGLGATFSERSGIANIGLEGIMLIGAFTGAVGAYFSGNPWVGVLLGLLSGTLLGLLLSLLTITYKAHQFVTGIGLNIFATGLTAVLTVAFWGTQGYSPRVEGIPTLHLAFLDHIPFIGPILSRQPYLVWLTFFLAVVSWVFFFRTKKGLRIRALGENPEAASAIGLPVNRLCYISVIISSMLASLGGVYLSLTMANLFNVGISGGRGFIGLAACIFGNWNPLGVLAAGLLFGLGEAVQIQILGGTIPPQFIAMLPYLITIVAVCGAMHKTRPPAAAGKQYEGKIVT